jgi:NAD(P)-dependent dehydrogenase (short-subunit alcohol dehydrogenase family)
VVRLLAAPDRTPNLPPLDQFRPDGRVAIVTGACSGLGVGFAQAVAQAGADLVLVVLREVDWRTPASLSKPKAGARSPSGPTSAIPATATRSSLAINEFGRVDILVNNAGVGTALAARRTYLTALLSASVVHDAGGSGFGSVGQTARIRTAAVGPWRLPRRPAPRRRQRPSRSGRSA